MLNKRSISNKRLLIRFLRYENYERIFIWSIAIFSLAIQPLLNTYYLSEATTFILLALSIISFVSLGFYKKHPKGSFFLVVASFGVILAISNAIFSATNGGGPILAVTQMFYSVVLIYRYGIKKTWWIPVFYVFCAYAHLFAFQSGKFSHWSIDDPISIKYALYFLLIGTALFVFSLTFSKKLNVASTRLTKTTERLQQTRDEVEKSTRELELAYKAIKKISNHNSHDLRRPVARILSLLQVYHDMGEELEVVESMIGKSLKEEINKAIQEMSIQLNDFEELLKVNRN